MRGARGSSCSRLSVGGAFQLGNEASNGQRESDAQTHLGRPAALPDPYAADRGGAGDGRSRTEIDVGRFREFERTAHDRIAESYHAFFVPITEHAAETAHRVQDRLGPKEVSRE